MAILDLIVSVLNLERPPIPRFVDWVVVRIVGCITGLGFFVESRTRDGAGGSGGRITQNPKLRSVDFYLSERPVLRSLLVFD